MSGRKIKNATSDFALMLRNPKSQETKSQAQNLKRAHIVFGDFGFGICLALGT
jgi:hypothetical protein